nr:EAL domain-containing protein [Aquisalinus flavus]
MIREGLENGEFEAWFQPVVRLNDEDIAGFEALARWRRPGIAAPLLPDQFMDIAIDAGLEMDITAIILAQAAAELAAWVGSSAAQGQFVSFNVSAETLINDRLVKLVRNTIRKYDLPDGALVVELTESHVLHDQHKVLSVAKAMRQAGARIALDDLGAGQSTLGQLSKFRFDIIKTDRALLDAAQRDDHGHTLLAGLVDMAHRMGTQIIAEGAETADAVKMLQAMKCDFAQGYYFGMPEPAGGAEQEDQAPRQPVTADLR